MATAMQNWFSTNCPGAFHATINGRHYIVFFNENQIQPAIIAECDGEQIGVVEAWATDYQYDAERETAKVICEHHAQGTAGSVQYGPSPVPVPVPHVSRVVG